MYRFKVKILDNEGKIFGSKIELLNVKITLPLSKLGMVNSKLFSNGLIFSHEILINVQLVTSSLLSNISELRIGCKNF